MVTRQVCPQHGATKLTIEDAAKLAGAAIVLLYGTGLLVVNAFLLQYGVADFNLFRARFIFTGLLIAGLIVISTVCPIWSGLLLRYYCRTRKLPVRPEDKRKRDMQKLLVVGSAWIFLFIPFFVIGFLLLQPLLICLLVYGVFAAFGFLIVWITVPLLRTPKRDKTSESSQNSVNDTSEHDKTARKNAAEPPWWIDYGSQVALAFVFAFLMVLTAAKAVLPNVAEQFGGARGHSVQLLISHDSVAGVQQLGISMNPKMDTTNNLDLLFTGEDFYVVRCGGSIRVLMANLVAGVNPQPLSGPGRGRCLRAWRLRDAGPGR